MYFECNLDRKVPKFYHPAIYKRLEETIALIHRRTDKLNKALSYCNLPGCQTPEATFADIASRIFNFDPFTPGRLLDSMTPKKFAKLAETFYDGHDAEDRIEWPNSVVLFDTRFVTTYDWEALRHVGIGGSESSIFTGTNPYQTKEGLWYQKLGYPEYISDQEERKAVFDRGHFLEDRVVEAFGNLTMAHRIPESRMFRSKKYPSSTANIDAVLRMPDGSIALFEAKTAIPQKKTEWAGDRIPANYVSQCHQYMGVLDDSRICGCYIGMIPVGDITADGKYIGSAYDAGELFHHFVAPDPELEREIMEAEKEFWDTYIVNEIKPEPSGDAELDHKVYEQYTPTPLTVKDAPDLELSYEDWEALLLETHKAEADYSLKSKIAEGAKEERDNKRLELLKAIGPATTTVYKDASGNERAKIVNKVSTRSTVDRKKLQKECPDLDISKVLNVTKSAKFTLSIN